MSIVKILNKLFNEKKDVFFIKDALNNKEYSYSDFLDIVLTIKRNFEKQCIKENDVVCFICKNNIFSLATYIASLLHGNIIAPIDCLKGNKEIEEIIEMVKPKYILDLDNLELLDYGKHDFSFENINYDKPYLLTFTSGSTAIPKGVIHSFKNLVLSALDFGKKFKFNSENIFSHNFPMAYMAGILNTFIMPMIFESKIVIMNRQSFQTALCFWNDIEKNNINTIWFNPTYISLLMNLDRGTVGIEYANKTNIIACVGTAPLSLKLKLDFEGKYGFELYESYGLSETLFLTTNYPKSNTINSTGEILDSVDLIISDDKEISVKTPWNCIGYLGSNCNNNNDYFPTGDLGEVKNKNLFITGRKKDIIIKGGVNIAPKRIEQFIMKNFDEVVIMGLKDINLGEKIACFYVNEKYTEIQEKELNKEIFRELGKDYCIDYFKKLDKIPKNINFKVDKLKLKELYEV